MIVITVFIRSIMVIYVILVPVCATSNNYATLIYTKLNTLCTLISRLPQCNWYWYFTIIR